jgi:HlyD family secretion protein
MTANVSVIIADKENILRVPNAALRVKIQSGDLKEPAPKGPGVWVLENKKPKRVSLKLGISDNRFTEVTAGDISESDAIIVEVKSNSSKASGQSPRPPGPGYLR